MRFLLALMLCSLLEAAITVTCDVADSRCTAPSTIAIATVQNGPSDYGFKVTIGGSGSWTLANNDCFFNYQASASSGTAPATVFVHYYLSSDALGPGTRSCHLQFDTGVTITINETITARRARIFASNPLHIPDASIPDCTETISGQYFPCGDTLQTADPKPGGNRAGFPPGLGNTYTDPNLGGVWTQITTPNCINTYQNNIAVDVTNTYLACNDLVGGTHLYKNITTSPVDTGILLGGQCAPGGIIWSTLHPTRFWCFDQVTTIHQYHLTGSTPTVVDDGVIYTDSVGTITTTGEESASKDDWIGFYTGACRLSTCPADAHMGAINLNDPSELVLYDLDQLPGGLPATVGSVTIQNKDPNGTRYLWLNIGGVETRLFTFEDTDAVPVLYLNSLGDAGLGQADDQTSPYSQLCTPPGCIPSGHNAVYEVGGYQYRLQPSVTRQLPSFLYLNGLYRTGYLENANVAEELGGGLGFQTMQSSEPGCAMLAPVCVGNNNQAQNTPKTSVRITNVTGSSPFTVTTNSAHGYSPGDPVMLATIGGMTLNGTTGPSWRFTVNTTPTATSFTVSATATGSYTASTGVSTTDVVWSREDWHDNEIVVCRMDNRHCRRMGKGLNVGYTDTWLGANSYFDAPHSAITIDGKYIITVCQGGIPDYYPQCMMPTGFDLDEDTETWEFDKNGHGVYTTVLGTSTLFTVEAPSTADCQIQYTSVQNFDSPTTVALPGPSLSRSTTEAGFSAGTTYYYNASCDNYWYGSGSFVATSGSGATWSGSFTLSGDVTIP